jgi:multidrug efflux pump subunit AcrA (membrane-fusion protein)
LKVVSRPAQVEQGTATIPIRVAFASPTNLSAGLPVQVEIQAEQHNNVVLVPSAAIAREGEETAVFIAKGDKAERRPVMIGISDDEHTEIRSGVKAGEMVIVEGQNGLPDGAAISVETGDKGADEKGAGGNKADEDSQK